MKNIYQMKVKRRSTMLAFLLMLWMALIILRLLQLQVLDHELYKHRVLNQNQDKSPIYPKRGNIFDRNGNILARSVPKQSIFYRPSRMESLEVQLERIRTLKGLLGLSQVKIEEIKTRIANDDPFIWVKRKVDAETAAQVKELQLDGIDSLEENKRFYPHGKLAAHILGRINIDEEGISGVEYKYNSVLKGKLGTRLILTDAKSRAYQFETLKEPIPGKDLVLAIDETIQYIAERELAEAVEGCGAEWGTVIVSHPSTGEILAMANYPAFDPNQPPALIRNNAIHYASDPGSTFKIITASAALESETMGLEEAFDCSEGAILVAGNTIRDHKRFGVLSFPEVIIHSSNVGAAQIGQKVGSRDLYRTIKEFGFGQKTGIDLPAEESGIFRPPPKWTEGTLSYLSIGYEIAVTPIQMLQALNIIANEGVLLPPRIVREIPDGFQRTEVNSEEAKRAISAQTARKMAQILEAVVESGTGKAAQVKGYRVAGKTGTAQKINTQTGGYSSVSHAASFVGYVLQERPIFSMAVVIDRPQGLYYGGQVAAPLFQRIASQILKYLGVPPREGTLRTLIAAKDGRQSLQ